jgi:hypothetical protein
MPVFEENIFFYQMLSSPLHTFTILLLLVKLMTPTNVGGKILYTLGPNLSFHIDPIFSFLPRLFFLHSFFLVVFISFPDLIFS